MDKKDETPKPPTRYPPAPPRMEPKFDAMMNYGMALWKVETLINPNGEKEWESLRDQLTESVLKNMYKPKK